MKFLLFPAILCGTLSFAQAPTPQLSTADKVAIQAIESAKQNAAKQWQDSQQQDSQQQELAILREWQAAHPGYHINQTTFAVEEEPKAPTSKAKPLTPATPKVEEKSKDAKK